jgi:hypothetical protein
MSDDVFSATRRRTPGYGKIRLWFAALAIAGAYGALVIAQLDGTARIGFGTPAALMFVTIIGWQFYRWKVDRRLGALVSTAIASGQGIRARRVSPSTSIHEIWLGEDEGSKMRVTEWDLGVMRATPGVEVIHEE